MSVDILKSPSGPRRITAEAAINATQQLRRAGVALLVVLAVVGCAPLRGVTVPQAPGPPRPTTWTLQHAVIGSDRLRVVGGSIDAFEQTSSVRVAGAVGRPADQCFVLVDVVDNGGPDRMVGEKVKTRVRGRPAFRNGAGAEGPYVMWRAEDRRWVTVQCEQQNSIMVVADRVRTERDSILRVPFALTVPDGYAVSSVNASTDPLEVGVIIDGPRRYDESSLYVNVRPSAGSSEPVGEPTTVAGRPGLRYEGPKFPSICVAASQPTFVCVGPTPSDTGPYPDRSDELPAMEEIAASLRLADLARATSWFDADDALR